MFLPFHFTAWLLASPYTLRYIPLPAQLRSFSSQRMPQLEGTIKGSVAKFNFWVKIQKSGIRNSRSYRLPNCRKSNFATEPDNVHALLRPLGHPRARHVPEVNIELQQPLTTLQFRGQQLHGLMLRLVRRADDHLSGD